jgi:REP element-mobilizing transposase RayT
MATKKQKVKRRARGARQLELEFRTHGGKRKGAGRKPKSALAKVKHAARPALTRHHVALVTSRVLDRVTGLRRKVQWKVVRRSILRGCERFGMRLIEFSVQGNHIHYLCEADDRKALTRGMQGLSIRIAKGLNKALDASGKVFADRYHGRVLETPLEVRRALAYVLNNARKHARSGQPWQGWIDTFSSAPWFGGWQVAPRPRFPDGDQRPVPEPSNWLLRVGWRRHGLIRTAEIPSSGMALAE